MVTKLFLSVPQDCGIGRDEESQQNDLRRSPAMAKIILRQLDEVSDKKDKLQQNIVL